MPEVTATIEFRFTLSADGAGEGGVTFPSFSLSAEGGAEATISFPAFTIEATGEDVKGGDGTVEFPAFTLSASGGVAGDTTGDVTFPAFTISAVGSTGGVAQIDFPAFTISATGGDDGVTSGAISFPAFTLSANGGEVLASEFEVVVVNARTGAHANYLNFPFNSFAKLNGVTLAAAADGLYALGGSLDGTSIIPASAVFGLSDMGTGEDKKVDDVWLKVRATGSLNVTVTYNETRATVLPVLSSALTPGIQRVRAKGRKGPSGNLIQIGVANVEGSDFEILDMEADVLPE